VEGYAVDGRTLVESREGSGMFILLIFWLTVIGLLVNVAFYSQIYDVDIFKMSAA